MTHQVITVPKIEVARYAAPRVTITPVTDVISAEPIPGRPKPGHYQGVLLNIRTGELQFHESTAHLEPWNKAWTAINDVPHQVWSRWNPGALFQSTGPHQWFEPVPELLSWTIDSGIPEWPYLNAAAANALLEEVAPVSQELLGSLFDGGGDLDWSAQSARAGRNMKRLFSRSRKAAGSETDADLVDFFEIVARFPQVYQPEMLCRPLDKLAEECEWPTRYLGVNEDWHGEIRSEFGKPYSDGSGIGLQVLGVRSWYRTILMNGDPRPLKEFEVWDGEHDRLTGSRITSTSTDTQVDAWVENEEENAARHGWRLLNVQEAAYQYREQLRSRDWDRLAVVGADIAALEEDTVPHAEKQLETRCAERTQLVAAAISWGCSDSEVAIRARVPRLAVRQLREGTGPLTGQLK
ncbi:hypothetical protein [Streptomyces fuscichromogenes]|uniref:Uncharacterized protein n=1 Tax=Streptomyces fuscichromogenes TaxID=1324013 RepID=A0A917XME6_9ACTN|nr:hypothetical protein [Streptomyces fuscichromogenes]GGN41065.1 hypothetical protein GCM10011578_088980 [Streptomyces fuscichromogenes]